MCINPLSPFICVTLFLKDDYISSKIGYRIEIALSQTARSIFLSADGDGKSPRAGKLFSAVLNYSISGRESSDRAPSIACGECVFDAHI